MHRPSHVVIPNVELLHAIFRRLEALADGRHGAVVKDGVDRRWRTIREGRRGLTEGTPKME